MLNTLDVSEKFFTAGSETVGSPQAETAATMNSETVKWGKLIKGYWLPRRINQTGEFDADYPSFARPGDALPD